MPSRPSKTAATKAASAGGKTTAGSGGKAAKTGKAAKAAPAEKARGAGKAATAAPPAKAKATAKAGQKTTTMQTEKAAKTAVKPQAAKTMKTTEKAGKAPAAAAAPAKKVGKAPELDKFLLEQLALLEEERRVYTEQAEALKAEADQLALEMEPGDIQFDEESGEGGTWNIDRERDLALSAQARMAVEEIDHALVKIANGTYGTCESCGQPILKARLKALPYARLCVACKSGGLSRR